MIHAEEYITETGSSPFAEWFEQLNAPAAAKVATAIARMEQGNFSNAKGVGDGVYEYTIDYGPGYRIYFGKDGNTLIVLLGGGIKKRQQQDINNAHKRWQFYKQLKRKVNFRGQYGSH
jgi:putative addiction module killer protein